MEKKNLIATVYAGYTFEDMEAEEICQLTKANNTMLSPIIRRDALEHLEVIEVTKQVFMRVVEQGMNVSGMRFDAAFYIATGSVLTDQKVTTSFSQATSSFVATTDKIADVTVESVRKSANWLGKWLVKQSTK